MSRSRGFPPIAAPDARVLVLGSLPGRRSLDAGEYYAHPRNAFWPIAGELFGFDPALPYAERCARLVAAGVALWDVLAASRRPGSLDSAIDLASAEANDFPAFFAGHPRIRLVACNGRKAAELFARFVEPVLAAPPPAVTLPSTSPAHAAMDYAGKLARWARIVEAPPA